MLTKIKRFFPTFLLLLLGIGGVLQAQPAQFLMDQHDKFGLGILIGDPSGISYKNYIDATNAVDAAFAWSIRETGGIYLHTDYLWHNYELFQNMEKDFEVKKGIFSLYYGIGGRLLIGSNKFNDSNAVLGARVPVGLNYLFESAPIELHMEVVPALDLIPATDPTFSAGIGARYYF